MNEEEKKAIQMLNKFITEHKFYNIKHSDNLEDNIEIVLNLIEKLQKKNEILKEEKEQAWEEWNNLEQGSCETEQKLKQQIKKLQKENEEVKRLIAHKNGYTKKLEEDLFENAENYVIPIQKVKDKIEKIKKEKKKYGNCLIEMYEDELVNRDIKILQELIEGRSRE